MPVGSLGFGPRSFLGLCSYLVGIYPGRNLCAHHCHPFLGWRLLQDVHLLSSDGCVGINRGMGLAE